MRIVVAPDSFKGTLSAYAAAEAIRLGIAEVFPAARVRTVPMADGGEGTSEVVWQARGGGWCSSRVTGPLPGTQVDARWLSGFGSGVGDLVEMAAASGLTLLAPHERDPLRTTTMGTGELLRAAADRGPASIRLAVGGSATVDGGTGAAVALGWRFLDARGRDVPAVGGSLARIRSIVPPGEGRWTPSTPLYRSASGSLEVLPAIGGLADVDNPLVGPRGAARVFGPQKGAGPAAVQALEAGLANLRDRIAGELGIQLAGLPGAGAAGGLAGGAAAFFAARIEPGVDWVIEQVGLAEAMEGADLVVTGEGRLDSQSLDGKVVAGVTRMAASLGVPVAVAAGRIELSESEWSRAGIRAVAPLLADADGPFGPVPTPTEAGRLLRVRAGQLALDVLGPDRRY